MPQTPTTRVVRLLPHLITVLIATAVSCDVCPTSQPLRTYVHPSLGLQIALDRSFLVSRVSSLGYLAWSPSLTIACVVSTLPNTSHTSPFALLDRVARIVADLSKLDERCRNSSTSLVRSPVYEYSQSQRSMTVTFDHSVDDRVFGSGVRSRLSQIISRLSLDRVGSLLPTAPTVEDVMVGHGVGFRVCVVVTGERLVMIGVTPAWRSWVELRSVVNAGSLHSVGTTGLRGAHCGEVVGVRRQEKTVDVILVADGNCRLRGDRQRVAGALIPGLMASLVKSGTPYHVSFTFRAPTAATISGLRFASTAVETQSLVSQMASGSVTEFERGRTLTGETRGRVAVLLFVGDSDLWASASELSSSIRRATSELGYSTTLVSGILCPPNTLCRDWTGASAGRELVVRTALSSSDEGMIGWLRPTCAVSPFMSTLASRVSAASRAAFSLPRDQPAVVRSIALSAVTGGSRALPCGCNWRSIPRSRVNGYDVVGGTVSLFGHCSLPAGVAVRFLASYSWWFDNSTAPNPTPEVCDGVDNDLDGEVDEGFDLDDDGWSSCSSPKDCDDSDPSSHPGAVEVCGDDRDNDCDGEVDEDCQPPFSLVARDISLDCSAGSTTLTFTLDTTRNVSITSVVLPWPGAVSAVPGDNVELLPDSLEIVYFVPPFSSQSYAVVLASLFSLSSADTRNITVVSGTDTRASIVFPALSPIPVVPDSRRRPPPSVWSLAGVSFRRLEESETEVRIIERRGLTTYGRIPGQLLPSLDPVSMIPLLSRSVSFTSNDTLRALFSFSPSAGASPMDLVLFQSPPLRSPAYLFDSSAFFPGRAATSANDTFYFSASMSASVVYRGGEVLLLECLGGDAWAFLDGSLVLDLGGVHSTQRMSATFSLDTLGLELGTSHDLRVFSTHRHSRGVSSFRVAMPSPHWRCEEVDRCGNCTDSLPDPPSGDCQRDGDSDGVPDCRDSCPNDPSKTESTGDCGCGVPDSADSDGDGVLDCVDACPGDHGKSSSSGFCGCGQSEQDFDGDGAPDCVDPCPRDPLKSREGPGLCGCGNDEADSDLDTVPDCVDACPDDPWKSRSSGVCGCGAPEDDTDEDGAPDCVDVCPTNPNKTNSSGVCGCSYVVDSGDTDGDGTPDCVDPCPRDPLKNVSQGLCGCGVTEGDGDRDGVPDCHDPCPDNPLVRSARDVVCPNASCARDGYLDSDGDGVLNCLDSCPADPNKTTSAGVCGCGASDSSDLDGDRVVDCLDACEENPFKWASPGTLGCGWAEWDNGTSPQRVCPLNDPYGKLLAGVCGCGASDTDADGDSVPWCNDTCETDPNKTSPGVCGCGVRESLEDGDGDSAPDCVDGCPLDPNKTAPGACGCGALDEDVDGDNRTCDDACPWNPSFWSSVPSCGCDRAPYEDSDGDAVADCYDPCPADLDKSEGPGQCGCGVPDRDSDEDGVADCRDDCPLNQFVWNLSSTRCPCDTVLLLGVCVPVCLGSGDKQFPGQCGCSVPDTDLDNDTWADCVDSCPSDPAKHLPGRCGCNVSEVDRDRDSTPDCVDSCPDDPVKNASSGLCGCGHSEVDSDGDHTPDCVDVCPRDPLKNSSLGTCGCGVPDFDADLDGHVCDDACPWNPDMWDPSLVSPCPNRTCDSSSFLDADLDGAPDCNDSCPTDPFKWAGPGICGCGVNDTDQDGDSLVDCLDACPLNKFKWIDPGRCDCGFADPLDPASPCVQRVCPPGSPVDFEGQCGCSRAPTDRDGDGSADCVDGCPDDPDKSDPGLCGCGTTEVDQDRDGTPDCVDQCPNDTSKVERGVCGCNVPDADRDADGRLDCEDGCPDDSRKTEPGACGCNRSDSVDRDGDKSPDCVDQCPEDPNKVYPGVCGCGANETDRDGDGTKDCEDQCPDDPNKSVPGQCLCGNPETDTDGDLVPNCVDLCPQDPFKSVPGACGCFFNETDSDNDTTPDCIDGCPYDSPKTSPGACGCSQPDVDHDGDGVPFCEDECDWNPKLTKATVCGCEVATDGDGDALPDCLDGCPKDPNKNASGVCGCGVPDSNSDGDSWYDCQETCVLDPLKKEPGVCGCGVNETDRDGDGTPDCVDGCPLDPLKNATGICGCGRVDSAVDTDLDGTPDCVDQCPGYVDRDSDGDMVADCLDRCPWDPLKTVPMRCGCGQPETDTDGDAYPDCDDVCPLNAEYARDSGPCGATSLDPAGCFQSSRKCPGVVGGCRRYCFNDSLHYPNPCIVCPDVNPWPPVPNVPDFAPPALFAPAFVSSSSPSSSSSSSSSSYPSSSVDDMTPIPPPFPWDCKGDDDGDGIVNCMDPCPDDPDKVMPGLCGCGKPDTNSDGDKLPDCRDGCPFNPHKLAPMTCGCEANETDTDEDGVFDCWDLCPVDNAKSVPAACGCNCADEDVDLDGVPQCPNTTRHDKRSTRGGTSVSLVCYNCIDQCPNDPSKGSQMACGCGQNETDTDMDGVKDCSDLCWQNARKTVPGVCGCDQDDSDSDGDRTRDCLDLCPLDRHSTRPSACGCGMDDSQCLPISRASPDHSNADRSGGIDVLLVVVLSVACLLVVLAVATATAIVARIRHGRLSASKGSSSLESSTGLPPSPIELPRTVEWHTGNHWCNGQI